MTCSKSSWGVQDARDDLMLNHDNPDETAITFYELATDQEIVSL